MLFLFVIILSLIGDLFWWRWANRRLRGWKRAAIAVFMLIQLCYMARILLTPYTARHGSATINVWGMATAYAWHLLIMPFTWLVIGGHELWTIIRAKVRAMRRRSPVLDSEIRGPRLHRREVLVAIPPLIAGIALGTSIGELHQFRIRRMQVQLKGLPAALDGMTIAHVADTHIGRFTNDAQLLHLVDATNNLDADLMLFAGDLIDVAQADLEPAIEFAKLLRGRYGQFFCEGNHDLIEDVNHETRVFETTTRAAGLPMLFDESATVQVRGHSVQILGGRWNRTWQERSRATDNLMQQVDPNAFSILLSHHPHAWDSSTVPLTLSGHTHGGQLMLNERVGVGPILFHYWSGLYQRDDQALVVCNGAGNWFPLRTYAPAEIIHLTLRTAL